MNKVCLVVIAIAGLAFAAIAVEAVQESAIERLERAGIRDLSPAASVKTDCQVGNLNPPVSIVTGFFTGDERYKYLIYPPDQCPCVDGFLLENVSMSLHFEPGMVPVTFDAFCDLGDAVWDPVEECWVPGDDLCVSSVQTFHVEEPGDYTLTVIMDDCQCTTMDHHYFIGITIVDVFDANLVIDGFPEPCITYNNKGTGWEDLYDWFKRSSGKIRVWGDVICCDGPIDDEIRTWGAIKSLYQ